MVFLSKKVANIGKFRKFWPNFFLTLSELPISKQAQTMKFDHNNTPHGDIYIQYLCQRYLTKMFCQDSVHTLICYKNWHSEIFVLVWACIVHKTGEILSRGNIIFAFSSLKLVETINFMLVACLVGSENNLKLCCLS